MKNRGFLLSGAVSIILLALIAVVWFTEHVSYKPNELELTDNASVYEFLEQASIDPEADDTASVGLYISSVQLKSGNDVEVTGYVWQSMDRELIDRETMGIIFPESVGGTVMGERYCYDSGDSVTVGWYFETVLRQRFDYRKYPLDHKTIWIRMLPADFSSVLLLMPDLDSYAATGYEDTFGISNDIVLVGWDLTETFFDYRNKLYDTSFGLGEGYMRENHPELTFNIVIERNFGQAVIVNLTLIIVIMVLLYSLLLMITSEEEKMLTHFGVSASGAIGTASALFFSVLLAHIDLRSMFGGQLVYLEMYYYVAYIFILSVSVLVFIFMKDMKNQHRRFVKSNAMLPKLLYWPLYLGIMLAVTCHWL